jgi:multiple sugar transport system permease protein
MVPALRKWVFNLINYLFLTFLAIIFLYPTLNMVKLSFLQYGPQGSFLSFRNYTILFEVPFGQYVENSLIIVSVTVMSGLIVNGLLAYMLARMQWRWSYLVVGLVVALLIVPFEAVAVPLVLLTNFLDWLDSLHVQIVPFIADPFSIFLFYQFWLKFPSQLEDAALVDGLGRLRIYWEIVVPNSRPAFATVAILKSLFLWDSYLWPLMVTRGPEFRPLPLGLRHDFGTGGAMAYATLMTVPVLILFVGLQKWFVKSLTAQI